MFEASTSPRIFGVPLGVDFSRSLHEGLCDRFAGLAPEEVARAEIYVNTRRMQRRLTSLFHTGDALLLPRIRLLTDVPADPEMLAVAPPVAPLRRRLELAQLVKTLIAADPTLAARTAAFDLADSLAALMAEMQGEGVSSGDIANLDVADQSGHWQRALSFINLVQTVFDNDAQPDVDGRQRQMVEARIASWQTEPPDHPVIVAGSTGSRGATSLFMQAVSRLPQGAVILPGVDYDLPKAVWDRLDPEEGAEDHPQYRFKTFCDAVGLSPGDIPKWTEASPVSPERNQLISLSLRPAPVTDQWIEDGPALGDLRAATTGLTLIEAPTPRAEADAIAVRLRQSVEDGKTAALITPDRIVTRQVTSALDRWGITPDDSAGVPLQLTAPGRLLRHVSDAMTDTLDAELLLVILRHPLCNSGGQDRGRHNLNTDALELEIRRNGPPYPSRESLLAWATKGENPNPDRIEWATWIADVLLGAKVSGSPDLAELVALHFDLAERLAAGPAPQDAPNELWRQAAGREALRVMTEVRHHADAGGQMTAWDYRQLIGSVLSTGEVRDRDAGHPHVLIWGTLEARVQSADLLILAGLNEGTWPEAAAPDPWLNRSMRKQAGLLLPERRIGLSAHDYQQAVCGTEVVLSRAIRSDEAETVPSRWINRLTNLLGGLGEKEGPACLDAMRARGRAWLDLAATIAAPLAQADPAPRPSPAPPTEARPTRLSVTQIKTLIRDPYAIYARKILGLDALDPLAQGANAPLRGTIIHEVLERFITERIDPHAEEATERLMKIADDVLETECPWPAVRTLWRARIANFADHFVNAEKARQATSTTIATEVRGELVLPNIGFTLTGTADRIDLGDDGQAMIYDYKTGKAPTESQQKTFDKQLLLEAAMVERGAFRDVQPVRTKAAVYIGLGTDLKDQPAPLNDAPPDTVLAQFEGLIAKWMDPAKGYTSRRANETLRFEGPYDHLARYGEWTEADEPETEILQ